MLMIKKLKGHAFLLSSLTIVLFLVFTAIALSSGRYIGIIDNIPQNIGKVIHPNIGADYYSFRVKEKSKLIVNVIEVKQPVEVELLDEDGRTVIAIAKKTGGQKSINYGPLFTKKSYFFRVSADSETPYELIVKALPLSVAEPDIGQIKKIQSVLFIVGFTFLVIIILSAWHAGLRKTAQNISLLFLGLSISLIIGEIIFRLVPTSLTFIEVPIASKIDKDLGYTFAPNNLFSFQSDCINVYPIRTNSLGFRDDEWTKQDYHGIAILGDSFIAAREIPDGYNTADLLQRIVRHSVLNFGVSGYGTVTELATYKKYVRIYKPKVVILFFLIANDLSDNNAAMTFWEMGSVYQPVGYIVDGEVKYYSPPVGGRGHFEVEHGSIGLALRKKCYTCRVIYNFFNYIWPDLGKVVFGRGFYHSSVTNLATAHYPDDLKNYIERGIRELKDLYGTDNQNYKFKGCYSPPTSQVWQDSWRITRDALHRLGQEIRSDGAKLIIVLAPDPIDEDLSYPIDQLKDISNEIDAIFYDMRPTFKKYSSLHREFQNLKFSFICDGHRNPMGHFIVANDLALFLIEHELVTVTPDRYDILLKTIKRNLTLSPKEILGDKGYDQIFNKKVFTGETFIDRYID